MNTDKEIIDMIQGLNQVDASEAAASRAVDRVRDEIAQTTVSPVSTIPQPVGVIEHQPAPFERSSRIAVLATLALLVVICFVAFLVVSRPNAIAAMMRAVERTECAVAELIVYGEPDQPPARSTATFAANGDYRIDEPNGRSVVHSFEKETTLIVEASKRQATIVYGTPPVAKVNLYAEIRAWQHSEDVEWMGSEKVNDIECRIARVLVKFKDGPLSVAKIWVANSSKLPVRIEFRSADAADRTGVQRLDNIRFDSELAEDTFSVAVPKGFEQVDLRGNPVDPSAANGRRDTDDRDDSEQVDPLAVVLELAKIDLDSAVARFVSDPPENWVKSCRFEDFGLSEAEFVSTPIRDRAELQQTFIDRAIEIKSFARVVTAKANELDAVGDRETAEKYIAEVRRLGEQMQEADLVAVYKQLGRALTLTALDR